MKLLIETLDVSNTTRWAVVASEKMLSYEVEKYGIIANNVLPGSIETEQLEKLMEQKVEKKKVDIKTICQDSCRSNSSRQNWNACRCS
ncbi:hypothetical protein [Coxiella-like endosymbiont]|uniref:hypothetical protein n=1 Tax=Coxiella-like endosymbiont TaxID=1592897 RepID=UPI00272B6210|nr:hypothetical protein [Coxiella-like endosymbiont]